MATSSSNELRQRKAGAQENKGVCCLTVGCFDMFHFGHNTLFKRLQAASDKLVVGVHDDQSIWLNKKFRTTDCSAKRLGTVQQALRPQDEAFIICAQDPTPYWVGGVDDYGVEVDGLLPRLRKEGWNNFEYKRGDDWAQFPGRPALEKSGVKIILLPYTQGVSSTELRKRWGLNMRVLPEVITAPVLDIHEDYIYAPLRKALEVVAALSFFPKFITPNMVTMASVLTAIPFILLNLYGYHISACVLCVFHDMLDRMDGAVAGALRKRADVVVEGPRVYKNGNLVHDGEFGAFMDAMGDKMFGISALLVLICMDGLPTWWKVIAVLKLPLHAALSFVRTQDYIAKLRGASKPGLPAVGVGKFATCSENFGCAIASLAVGTMGMSVPFLGAGAMAVAGVLSLFSIDMAMRSLSHKLRARAQESPVVGTLTPATSAPPSDKSETSSDSKASARESDDGEGEGVNVKESPVKLLAKKSKRSTASMSTSASAAAMDIQADSDME